MIRPLKAWYSLHKNVFIVENSIGNVEIICVINSVITLILFVIDYSIFDDNSFTTEGRSKELVLSFFNKLFLWCRHVVENSFLLYKLM